MLGMDSVGRKRTEEFVEHYNVKGSKWHTHKFGKWQKHAVYAHGRDDPNKKDSEKKPSFEKFRDSMEKKRKVKAAKKKVKETVQKRKAEEEERKKAAQEEKLREEAKEKAIKTSDPILAYKNREAFTSQELQSLINRVNQENTLRDLASKEQQRRKGKDFVTKVTDVSKKVNQLYDIYNSKAGKAITKEVAKALGFTPKKSFIEKLTKSSDIEFIWKNYDKLTSKQVAEVIGRINNRNKLKSMYEEYLKEQKKGGTS